jgi:hypothetical protein
MAPKTQTPPNSRFFDSGYFDISSMVLFGIQFMAILIFLQAFQLQIMGTGGYWDTSPVQRNTGESAGTLSTH